MLGSIDCMHWVWKNCTMEWHGSYIGKEKWLTLILEAVESHKLFIWHFHFCFPGSLNFSVLDQSPVLDAFCCGQDVETFFTIQGKQFPCGY